MEIKGIDKDKVIEISNFKQEDKWILDYRLDSFNNFSKLSMPEFGPKINFSFDDIIYYKSNSNGISRDWKDINDNVYSELNNLGVDNFKISSKTHVWNAVYLNDKWLHLDLTWDDPVTINSDTQTLSHKFYLIDTKSLDAYKISDHEFDKSIYPELK